MPATAEQISDVYARYYERMCRMAIRTLKYRDEAEEAVQGAFVLAWRFREQFDGRGRLSTWLLKILTNQCRTEIRARRARVSGREVQFAELLYDSPRSKHHDDFEPAAEDRTLDRLIDAERRRRLNVALYRLSVGERSVILRILAGGPTVLQGGTSSDKVRKLRAVAKLRSMLFDAED